MAFNIGDLIARVGMNLDGFREGAREISSTLDQVAGKMGTVGAKMTAALAVPIVGIGVAAIKTAGELEQNSIAFTTMMGSADAASKHLKDLRDFAARTPFQFNDLVLASKRMQALGFEGKQVIPILTNIGDAAAALGMGAEGMQRIVTAIGQMQAKGKVQAEEMRQLAEAGIPAWQILAKTLNTDVAGAMKMVEQRAVDSAKAIPAILAGMNEKFGGLMEKQAKTLLGKWSDLKDQIVFALTDVGTALMPVAKTLMESLLLPALNVVKGLATAFGQLPPSVQTLAIGIAGLAAAAGPLLFVVGNLVTTIGELKLVFGGLSLTAINPVILGIVGVAGAVGVLYSAFKDLRAEAERHDKVFDEWITSLGAGARTAKGVAEAQQKINEAVEKGLVSKEAAAKALELLADREKKIVGSKVNESLGLTGLKLHVVAEEGKKTAAASEEVREKLRAIPFEEKGLESAILAEKIRLLAAEHRSFVTQVAKAGSLELFHANAAQNVREAMEALANPPAVDGIGKMAEGLEHILNSTPKLPADLQAIADALDAFGLASKSANIEFLQRNFEVLGEGLESGTVTVEQYTRAWIALVKAMDAAGEPLDEATKREVIKLEEQYGGQIKQTRKEMNEYQREADRAFNAVSRGISRNIVDLKGFGKTGINVAKDLASGFLEIMLQQLLNPLKEQFTNLAGHIGDALGSALGIGSSAASGASGAAGAAGSAASGAGSAASGAAGAASAATGWMGAVNMVSGLVSAVSGVFSAIGTFRLEGTMNAVEHNTRYLQIQFEQYLGEHYLFKGQLFLKLDDIWNSIRGLGAVNAGGGNATLESIRDYTRLTVRKFDEFVVPRMDQMIALMQGGSLAGAGGAYFDFRGSTFGAGITQQAVDSMFQTAYQRARAKVGG